MTLAELHERLLAWAGADERQPWLLAARRDHFARVGEPHEEDKGYEARMNGLLDHYLYDFRPDGQETTLDLFLRYGAGDLTTDERAEMRELGRNLHSLVEVKKIRPGVGDLLAQLSRMALRLERYRNVQVESIYDFGAPPGRTAS